MFGNDRLDNQHHSSSSTSKLLPLPINSPVSSSSNGSSSSGSRFKNNYFLNRTKSNSNSQDHDNDDDHDELGGTPQASAGDDDSVYDKHSTRSIRTFRRLSSSLIKNPIKLIRSRIRSILLILFLGLGLYYYFVETHVEIAFYRRGWIKSLLPADPPNLSTKCFSQAFLDNPFNNIDQDSFPSSPAYNLSLGSLTLSPKVLSLSPGFSLRHHDDCYRFGSTLPLKPLESMRNSLIDQKNHVTYFHLYWRSDLAPISQRQIVTLKSLLATQSFDFSTNLLKPSSQIILWTNPSPRSLENDPMLAPLLFRFHDRLTLKVLDLTRLTLRTPLENHSLISNDRVFDKRAWIDGDLVRVLVLWQYGGYWVDMDNLVLRDLRVLGEHEWVVMWDCYDKPYEPLNGHMMHFFKHSPYLCEMMNIMSKKPEPRPASTDWGQHLYHRLYRSLINSRVRPFKVLPYCLTDGRSCNLKDRIPDPFVSFEEESSWGWSPDRWKQFKLKRLDPIFSIHLHNQWSKQFDKRGWVSRFFISNWESDLKFKGIVAKY
ncbi:hypothetical protein BY996DRAFT_6430032 [Phakopsora pachyrhizi]|nr:hypothetical protein BY996DRAFT_6430032 [Phakopsora pachyrhizi]